MYIRDIDIDGNGPNICEDNMILYFCNSTKVNASVTYTILILDGFKHESIFIVYEMLDIT